MGKCKRNERNEGNRVLDQTDLQCTQPGCTDTAQNKAGLVNHQRQKCGATAQEILFVVTATKTLNNNVRNHTKFCNQI